MDSANGIENVNASAELGSLDEGFQKPSANR